MSKNKVMAKTILVSAILSLASIHVVEALDGSYQEAMEVRRLLSIKGVDTYIREGGIALDAIRLIQSNGIVSFADYYDITGPYGQANISEMINIAGSFTDQIMAMYQGMDIVYTAPPTQTHIPGSTDVNDPNLTYYIKDSYDTLRFIDGSLYWGYFYLSDADNLHESLWEMTTVKLSTAP